MSTVGVLEILFHMGSFRNIDLYYQGLYYVKITCIYPAGKVKALRIERGPVFVPSNHPHYLHCPRLFEAENSISSRVFLVRYSDEVVKLHETAVFRAEITRTPGVPDSPLEVQVELFFTDLGGGITMNKVYKAVNEQFSELQFNRVSISKLKVAYPVLGVSQFIPVVFGDLYSSVVLSSFHCMLVNYKVKSENEAAESLFPKEGATLSAEKIERVYHSVVWLLALTHNKVRGLLLDILTESGAGKASGLLPNVITLPLTVENDEDLAQSEGDILRAPFTSCIKTRDKNEVTRIVLDEIEGVSHRITAVKQLLLTVIRDYPTLLIEVMEPAYHQQFRARASEQFNQDCKAKKFPILPDPLLSERHGALVKSRRKTRNNVHIDPLGVEDTDVFLRPELSHLIFEEIYSFDPSAFNELWSPYWFTTRMAPEYRETTHLFVLVHGFMGTTYDMKFVRDTLSLLLPHTVFLTSRTNEGRTEGSIDQMGERLAAEVLEFLSHITNLSKISFIGHSLGGIIIRAALPYLSEYKNKLNLLMTLNSPHLGCSNGGSKLIDAGIWVITKLKKSISLTQLSLTDDSNIENCYLYGLSRTEGLSWFKNIILASSGQDRYVPFESARIEAGKGENGQIEMVTSLLSGLVYTKLVRIDVNFGIEGKKIGALIGRSAHILMLDNRSLLTMLAYRYADAFI